MMSKVYGCGYTLVLCNNKVLCAMGDDSWIGLYCPYQPLMYYDAYDEWAPIGWAAKNVKSKEEREWLDNISTSKK